MTAGEILIPSKLVDSSSGLSFRKLTSKEGVGEISIDRGLGD
ncbi:hypothetical protein SCG7086_CS_00010 [Chlamydiales bacterium SCGC AG-110-P3]|nr:hypothetical protein SCG7086_CS_00010 [Chlamydiales bacterium SCGC AG-110-P3]